MKITHRVSSSEQDYAAVRAFLRKIHLLNQRYENAWPVARLDYWRWHGLLNCQGIDQVFPFIHLWSDENGEMVAVMTPEGEKEAHFHVHPAYQTESLETEMILTAERQLGFQQKNGTYKLYIWVNQDHPFRDKILTEHGYQPFPHPEHQHYRDLTPPIPDVPVVPGYTIRALGGVEELPARSWASWRAFHPDQPDEDYSGWVWYHNIQRCPLYRRDLDIVAVAEDGSIAAFCTLWYDDVTQTGYFEPVGTVPEHQQRGLGKAVMLAAMTRLKRMNGLVAMVGGYSSAANALYASVVSREVRLYQPWVKEWK